MALCAAVATNGASAQTTSTWQAPGIASWNDPANWTSGVPTLAGDHAIFGPTQPTGDASIFVVDATTTVGTLTYDNPFQIDLTAPTMTFDGDGVAAMIDILNGHILFGSGNYVLATDLDISVAPGSSATVGIGFTPAASFNGPGGINVQGDGEVIFNGGNTYQGATHIQSGTLSIHHNNSLGTGTGTDTDGTFIHTGGVLELAKNNITLDNEKIIVDGGTITGNQMTLDGPIQLNAGTISGTGWTINGPFSATGGILTSSGWRLAGPTTLTGELTARGTGRFDGDITGAEGLLVDSVANIQLFGDNTYTGQTTVAGTLTARTDTALGAGTGTDVDGTTVVTGGQLVLSGSNPANEKITLDGGTLSGGGIVGGPIQVNGGIIADRIVVDGPVNFNSGLVRGNVILNGPVDVGGEVILDAGSDFVNGGTLINSDIGGTGDLIITGGAGETVNLSGNNTFAGQVTIDSGRLLIHHPNALGNAANQVVVEGGVLELNSVVNRPITLNSGGVILSDTSQPHTSNLVMTSGEILTGSVGQNITYQGNVLMTGPQGKKISSVDGLLFEGIISGAGPLTLDGRVGLKSANTYTGVTTITAERVDLEHPEGLGDTTSGTTVAGGALAIGVSGVDEPIRVESGTLILDTDVHAGNVTLAGGELLTRSFLGGIPRTLSTPLIIDGAGSLTTDDEDLILDGGVTGNGVLQFERTGDNFILNGPYTFTGDVVFDSVRDLVVNVPTTIPGRLWFDQGGILANEDVVLAAGAPSGFGRSKYTTAPGKTITVSDLNPANAWIDAELVGPASLTLSTGTEAIFQRLGTQFDGDINIVKGDLNLIGDEGLGTQAGGTYIRSNQNALLSIEGATISDDIYLNNATGYAYTGALLARSAAVVNGGIDLGDVGSALGNTNGQSTTRLTLSGPISGGSLTKVGVGITNITGNANTYTGETSLRQGELYLVDDGSLSTTSGIRIAGLFNSFIIDNSGTQNLPDRVADHIPFYLEGGALALKPTGGEVNTETLGVINLVSGHSLIESMPAGDAPTTLTLTSLNRNSGTSVDFLVTPRSELLVRIANPSPLDDGIIGGWATVRGENFATLGVDGVEPLTTDNPLINTANASDNVRLTAPAVMSGDRTINSLWMSDDVRDLDLNGHMLVVESGGVLGEPGATISNGQLTGSVEVGELIIHGRTNVTADIVDPASGSIGVTASGGFGARIALTGTNSYSGPTVVTTGTDLRFYGEQAVPTDNDVYVYGGEYRIVLDDVTTIDLGRVILDTNGFLQDTGEKTFIDADSYDLRWGTVDLGLVGSGTLTKSTPGTVHLSGDNRDFHGEIVVNEGILVTDNFIALGDGDIKVNTGGQLAYGRRGTTDPSGTIFLQGGELTSTLGLVTLVSDVHVVTDSGIFTARITERGQIAGTDLELSGNLTGSGNLTVTGSVNGALRLTGDSSAYTGDILVDGAELLISQDSAFITGAIKVQNLSSISLTSSDIPIDVWVEDSAIGISRPFPFDDPRFINGSLTFAGDSSFAGFETTHVESLITLKSGSVLRKTATGELTFNSEVRIGEDTSVIVHDGKVIFSGVIKTDHEFASLDLVSAEAVELSASIHIDSGHSLAITMNGESSPVLLTATGQSILGGGVLNNDLILSDGASMMPGSSAGMFTVDGDYTQLLDAILQIELGGTADGLFDVLAVTGVFDAGGIFEVLLIDGFLPRAGDRFAVLDFASVIPASQFDQYVLPQLGSGLEWDTSDLLNTGEIRVVPEPSGLLWAMAGLALLRRR